MNASKLLYRYAWPSGDWGILPLEGGIEAAYKAELEAADDPDGAARRDRGAAEPGPLAVPHRRGVPGRGDHRPARHPAAALRVRQPRRAAAPAGTLEPRDATMTRSDTGAEVPPPLPAATVIVLRDGGRRPGDAAVAP